MDCLCSVPYGTLADNRLLKVDRGLKDLFLWELNFKDCPWHRSRIAFVKNADLGSPGGAIVRASEVNCQMRIQHPMFPMMEMSLELILEQLVLEDSVGLDQHFAMAPLIEEEMGEHVRTSELALFWQVLWFSPLSTCSYRAIEVPQIRHTETELQCALTVSFSEVISGFFRRPRDWEVVSTVLEDVIRQSAGQALPTCSVFVQVC